MILRDLRKLTAGERLWLWRRQRGLTLDEAAAELGVDRRRVLQPMERDRRVNGAAPSIRGDVALTPRLVLQIARRRSGWGLRGAAARAGVSHVTFIALESAASERLFAFWRRQGFRF